MRCVRPEQGSAAVASNRWTDRAELLRSGHPSAENRHGSEKFYTMVSMGAAVRLLLLHSRQAARKGVPAFVIDLEVPHGTGQRTEPGSGSEQSEQKQ